MAIIPVMGPSVPIPSRAGVIDKSITDPEERLRHEEVFANSLSGLAEQLNSGGFEFPGLGGPQISSADTMWNNNRWYLISNFRQLLSQIYAEHGIVQTLVDQPVDDAYRAGFEIKSEMLDGNDIEQIMTYCERHQVIHSLMQSRKWGRLYGGGAIMIFTNQNPEKPLNIKAIGPNDPIEFRSSDMWELFTDVMNTSASVMVGGGLGAEMGDYYDYYGQKVHKSHVLRFIGKEAPSFIRPRLRGWGMSELERLVRSLNQYLKNQDLIFQLLDEAKVDVYGINGYNEALLTNDGTNSVSRRLQYANRMKSFNSALVMDSKDTYDQKQITFTGLADVLLQIRQGIAADLKMPMTKLFGISAAGFNSGEDDIENYNSMVEGEVRNKDKYLVIEVLGIVCQKLFGFRPDDLTINWNPLRILNAKEEEEVKDSQFVRVTSAFSLGLADGKEAKKAINKDSLLGIEVNENTDALPPLGLDMDAEGDDAGKPKPASGKSQSAPPR